MIKNPSIRIVFSYILFCITFAFVVISMIFLSSFLLTKAVSFEEVLEYDGSDLPVIIIDAGHGGEDGGAVGKNGTIEKDINLKIANDTADMLRACGFKVIMTRTEDILLYDKNTDFNGRKKMLDLAARLKIANETSSSIFISIHMNSFPIEKYNGLQVYYSKNSPESKMLAQKLQEAVKTTLQPDNERSIKAADKNIYLLDRAKTPAVLVECGFLSNYDECRRLSTTEYQKELSLSIFSGIQEYIVEINS